MTTTQADNAYSPYPSTVTNVKASGAVTATGQGTAQETSPFDERDRVAVLVDVTAVSGTTPSLTVSLEWSHNGTTWFTADPVDAFTALTAAGKRVKDFQIKAPYWRPVWTVSGTSPSFTFAVHAHYR